MNLAQERRRKTKLRSSSASAEFTSIDSVPSVDREAPVQKPKSVKKSFRLAFTIWTALTLLSLTGTVAVILHYLKNNMNEGDNSFVHANPKAPVEKPNTAPVKLNPISDDSKKDETFRNNIQLIAERCARMVTHKNSFAVFEHGTCVLLIEPIENPVLSAKSSLRILADPNMKFEVKVMNNNNYLVVFDKYLFCWLFADQVAKNKQSIMSDPRLARSSDDPVKFNNLSDMELRIGKLARLCLLQDSQKLNIKKLIRAKSSHKPSQKVSTPATDQGEKMPVEKE